MKACRCRCVSMNDKKRMRKKSKIKCSNWIENRAYTYTDKVYQIATYKSECADIKRLLGPQMHHQDKTLNVVRIDVPMRLINRLT